MGCWEATKCAAPAMVGQVLDVCEQSCSETDCEPVEPSDDVDGQGVGSLPTSSADSFARKAGRKAVILGLIATATLHVLGDPLR